MNPNKIAQAETLAWQAYYKKDTKNLFANTTKIFELQYGLTQQQANEIAKDYVKAAAILASLPEDTAAAIYQEKITPILEAAYENLNALYPLYNYKEAAKYDLAWWIARRNPKTENPRIVGNLMAQMYQAIFGKGHIQSFERATYFRAMAGQYRDLSHDKWGGITKDDWHIIQTNLQHTYQIIKNIADKNHSPTK